MQPPGGHGAVPPQATSPSSMGATTTAPWAGGGGGMGMAPTAAPWANQQAPPGRPDTSVIQPGHEPKVVPPNIVEASACMPQVKQGHIFEVPMKRISSHQHLKSFLESETLKEYIGFLMACSEAVKGKKLRDECPASPVLAQIQRELDALSAVIDEIPPLKVELRFGNPAYRDWFERMQEGAHQAMERILPEDLKDAAEELCKYWTDSFGNVVRIDYGTGHETTFAVFLFCLAKIGAVTEGCLQAVVTRVFVKYLELMRKLQTTYWLEPAGSHGVWGLDDYQFLPFYWGASQLIGHPMIKPKSIHNAEVLEGCSRDYLYLSCVDFVKQVKKGRLSETSPMLNDISAVPNWNKVNSGMMKMYQAEVMSKLPIMQHMLFGRLFAFPEGE